ncbi:TolC family protein [Sinobacterium norvegicum]|uniref:TolC family protein n=1 Tax=Sinobacterium norvegicum TaxID=1641715 RepID=UPI001F01A2C3|nr:TolC family protein [Sinobacterium norvegicum]
MTIYKTTTLLVPVLCGLLSVNSSLADTLGGLSVEADSVDAESYQASSTQPLSLQQAVVLALANEHGIRALLNSGQAMRQRAKSGDSWQDPTIKFGVSNLPTDSFDLDQEGMTQLKLGITQPLPRGDSNNIEAAVFDYQAASQYALAGERGLQVRQTVAISWLELWYAEQATTIYRNDRQLFADLLAVTESLYRVGKRNQNDVLQAQLEIDRQRDWHHRSIADVNSRRAALTQWLNVSDSQRSLATGLQPTIVNVDGDDYQKLLIHPAIVSIESQMSAQRQQLALAKEAYKPAWAVTVEYGKRYAEDGIGDQLPDMLTAMVSVDVPLFTGNRQDPMYQASQHELSSVTEQRQQALRLMRSRLDSLIAEQQQLIQRLSLYQTRLVPTSEQSAAVSLSAYQSGRGSFKEVVDSRLAVQQSKISLLRLTADLEILNTKLQYFLQPLPDELLTNYAIN